LIKKFQFRLHNKQVLGGVEVKTKRYFTRFALLAYEKKIFLKSATASVYRGILKSCT